MDLVASAIVGMLVVSLGLMLQGWVLAAVARRAGKDLAWSVAMVTVVVATVANALLGAVMNMVLAPQLIGMVLGFGVWSLAIGAVNQVPLRDALAIGAVMTVLTWFLGLLASALVAAVPGALAA